MSLCAGPSSDGSEPAKQGRVRVGQGFSGSYSSFVGLLARRFRLVWAFGRRLLAGAIPLALLAGAALGAVAPAGGRP